MLLNASTTKFPAGGVDRSSVTALLRASAHFVGRHCAGERRQILLEGIRIGHLYLSDDIGRWHGCLRMQECSTLNPRSVDATARATTFNLILI
jgi:hypothetical protein